MQLGLGEGDAAADGYGPPGRTHGSALVAQSAQVRDLELESGVPAIRAELRVDRDPAGAVQQRCRIAAVDRAERVVDAAIRRALENDPPALDFDQFEPQRAAHRWSETVFASRTKLLESVEVVRLIQHVAHQVSWNGRTSARNDQASRG